jgi:hypothetical protein
MRASPETDNADKACKYKLYRHLRIYERIGKNRVGYYLNISMGFVLIGIRIIRAIAAARFRDGRGR